MFTIEFASLLKASWETIYMVFIASLISIVFGLLLGCVMFMTNRKKTRHSTTFYHFLSLLLNIVRSLPFIILMITIIPFTRLIVGTSIGTTAAIVPLSIAAIPFYARICESALSEVSIGLIEAVQAMGASTWQLITKVLLPESLPALIRGGTLTIIALISYSAMAGAIGGGGLGELAINYGYQRFDVAVMFETVIVLIILVQMIQWLGDYFAERRQIKPILIASFFLLLTCVLYQFSPKATDQGDTLKVGVISGWSQEVMKVAAKYALQKYGITIEVIPFTDYVQPNTALNQGSIDVNVFQHLPYLEEQTKAQHYHLVPIAKTFVYPMGFYSKKISRLSQLKTNSIIAIPNDPSNESRALLLLQKFALIKLKGKVTTLASVNDIVDNPYHLHFKLLDAAQLPRSLNDAELVAITNDFLTATHLTIQNAIIKEGSDSLYANIIVVNEKNKDNPIFKQFIDVMHSEPVIKATEKIFPHGAAIKAW